MSTVLNGSNGRPATAALFFPAGFLLFAALLLVFIALGPERAEAGINGSVQYNYSLSSIKTASKTGGNTTSYNGQSLDQIYRLGLSDWIYPHLQFDAGGTLDRGAGEGGGYSSASTTLNPYAGLSFGTRPYSFGLNYSRTVQSSGAGAPLFGFGSGRSPQSSTYDIYSANFGWRPWGLPSLDIRYNNSHYFDSTHTMDGTEKGVSATSVYAPVRDLRFAYSADWSQTEDRINGTGITSIDNDLETSYRKNFWNDAVRTLWHNSFSFGASTLSRRPDSGGLVYMPVSPSPFDAFYVETPLAIVPADRVSFNQCQNYGGYECGEAPGLVTGAGSAPVNIGSNGNPDNVQTWQWEVGIEFSSSAATAANVLFLYLNQDISKLLTLLPGAFSWSVYTSTDDVNWSPVTVEQVNYSTVSPATVSNRPAFELDLPQDQQLPQWVKIVVNVASATNINILPPAERVQFSNIFITQAQVFNRQPANQMVETSSRYVSQDSGMNLNATLMQHPVSLNYTMNLGYDWADSMGTGSSAASSYRLWSTLSAFRQFGSHLADTASVSMRGGGSNGAVYTLNNSLAVNAGPLQSSLVYSYSFPNGQSMLSNNFNPAYAAASYLNGYLGRYMLSGMSATFNSIGIYNTYEVYPGLSAFLRTGYSFPGFSFMPLVSTGFFYNVGVDMRPYRTYHFAFNYYESHGGGQVFRQANGVVNWYPLSNLYLTCTDNLVSAPGVSVNAITYRVTFSPSSLNNGDLQFTFDFDQQGAAGPTNQSHTALGPGVTWRLAPSAILYASYNIIREEGDTAVTNIRAVSVSLTKTF